MPYPVTIRGEREPINRWLFLVKWLLIIPHVIVLAFLAIGFVFSWLAALFSIAFTGKYPRGLFDYNVGVLRWLWRVGFYSYQALGTDKYPPFSLKSDPTYPADLTIEYPAKLKQGLVLVKWWLLALPHYAVVGVLQGGLGYHGTGLQGLLLLYAAVVHLFTGKYPDDMHQLIMGTNRWTARVAGYAALTTDEYPPFSLS